MKKLISLILVLCMACMLIPAMADADITGEWYASFAGMVLTMNLNADGNGTMITPGSDEPAALTWTLEGDQLSLTIEGTAATATVAEDTIILAEDGTEFVFTREPVAGITVADVKAASSAEEFYGDWAITYIEMEGMILDSAGLAAYGLSMPNLKLGEGTVEFISGGETDLYSVILNSYAMTSSYADGALALAATTEGAEGITGTVETLTDGMIKLTLLNNGEPMVLYYSPAAAAEAPAA